MNKTITCIERSIVLGLFFFSGQVIAASQNAIQELEDLNKKIEVVKLLNHLDEVDTYINNPRRCGKKADALREQQNKLRQINTDNQHGRITGTNYSQSFDRTNKQKQTASEEFDRCFITYLNGLYKTYPDVLELNKKTWKELNNTYTSLLSQYYKSDLPSGELTKLKTKRQKLISDNRDWVAVLVARSSGVRIYRYRQQRWLPAENGQVLAIFDKIDTGSKGLATLKYLDLPDVFIGATIDLSPNTQIQVMDIKADVSKFAQKDTMTILKGIVRVIVKRWKKGSVFNIRAGTTITGVRGTDIEIDYNPDRDHIHYRLHSGRVDIMTSANKFIAANQFTLTTGQEVTINKGYVGTIHVMQKAPPL